MNDNKQEGAVGTLRISREVLATIVSSTAAEVPGVCRVAATPDLRGMLAKRQMIRPVTVFLEDDMAQVELHVVLAPEVKIPVVAERLQKAVKESVQSMTGIAVSKVNVVVEGIDYTGAQQ